MAGWREEKRAMRRVVHDTMLVPALYLLRKGAVPVACDVRLHVTPKLATGGAALSSQNGFASMLDQDPRIIFRRDQVAAPQRLALIVISDVEAYRVDATRPPDDEYITAVVGQLRADEMIGLPNPAAYSPVAP